MTLSESGPNTSFIPRVRVHGPSGQSLGDGIGDLWGEVDFTATVSGTDTVLASRSFPTRRSSDLVVTLAQAPGTFIVPAGDDGGALVVGANPPGAILRG